MESPSSTSPQDFLVLRLLIPPPWQKTKDKLQEEFCTSLITALSPGPLKSKGFCYACFRPSFYWASLPSYLSGRTYRIMIPSRIPEKPQNIQISNPIFRDMMAVLYCLTPEQISGRSTIRKWLRAESLPTLRIKYSMHSLDWKPGSSRPGIRIWAGTEPNGLLTHGMQTRT